MCDAVESRLIKNASQIGLHYVVAKIGWHEESSEDHLHRFLEERMRRQNTAPAIDKCISLLDVFWTRRPNAILQLFELDQNKRSGGDTWLSDFLEEYRKESLL